MKFLLGGYAEPVERRVARLVEGHAASRIFERDAAFWGGDDARRRSVASRLGWLTLASQMQAHAGEFDVFAADVRAGFDQCVLLGMGGSSLAPEVLARIFGARRLHVVDTTDPATIADVAGRVNPARTLFFVSSKSGTTVEALTLFAFFRERVARAKGDRAGENFVAVTDAGTPLETLARDHAFRRVFINPADIGGRYSALSYFGLAPAAAAGVDVAGLLASGVAAADAARAGRSDALVLGAALGELALEGRDKLTFLVEPSLAAFGLWAEQLIAESTGKLGRGIVPVDGEPQASPRGYRHDRVFVQVRREAGENGEIDAFAGALAAEGHPVVVIDIEEPRDLGGLFFGWEFAVAVAGQALDINPFDEPNVQESKDNTRRVLEEFERTHALDPAGTQRDGALALDPAGEVLGLEPAVAKLLSAVGPRAYLAITAYVLDDDASARAFAEIRKRVLEATGAATTLGYGPRFLHSTGQLHKGGPPEGVFLQVTADDAADLPIPGYPYTFGQLKRAQAIGDLQSLHAHGRPALRVHLGADRRAGLGRLVEAVRQATAARAKG